MVGWKGNCFGCRRSRREPQNEANFPDPPPVLPYMENVEVFTLDMLRQATNNFSKTALIADGLYAKMFVGQLPNRMMSVKRFITTKHTQLAEFMFRNELEIVESVHHDNIIRLIGYCTENQERIIVFEHLERRNLFLHLHPKQNGNISAFFTSWKMRVKILLDAAKGLQHLQHNAQQRVIHREITTASIWIDENWVAKISDFRMALFGPKQGNDYVPDEKTAGIEGYMDPAYIANKKHVYPCYDVYSFGIVILEVLTGLKPVDIDNIIYNQGRRFVEVRDKRLNTPVGGEKNAIQRVMRIARQCVAYFHYRIDINNVVSELEIALGECDQLLTRTPAKSPEEASTGANATASTR